VIHGFQSPPLQNTFSQSISLSGKRQPPITEKLHTVCTISADLGRKMGIDRMTRSGVFFRRFRNREE
jgi:hypothetical protein